MSILQKKASTTAILATFALLGAAFAAACGDSEDALKAKGDETKSGCESPEDYFKTKLYPNLLSQKCATCHTEGGAAGGTRLTFGKGVDIAAAFEKAKSLGTANGALPLLVQKSTGATSHGGGVVISAGSPEAAMLEGFVKLLAGECQSAVPAASLGQRQIRRLTRDEYQNTLRDLGVVGAYAEKLPADTVVSGFDNNGAELAVGGLFADQVQANAEEIGNTIDLARVSACDATKADQACAKATMESFGSKVFRRPPTADETNRYVALFEGVRAGEGSEAGMRTLVTALFQSPGFLYRTELGEDSQGDLTSLTPWELASEISYLAWRSMPDDALFGLAKSGKLADPAVIAQELDRALSDPKASATTKRFVDQWLEIERIEQSQKDAVVYPDYDAEIRVAMRAETSMFFDKVARSESGGLAELLTAGYTFVTPKLGAFYGLGPVAAQDQKTTTPPVRRGILTHGSVLATQATTQSASPVRRGKLVLEKFFCQTVPPPPPGLNAELPALEPGLPNRERFGRHSKDPSCAGCHSKMDPLGFGFEPFDGVGKHQPTVDGKGEIKGTPTSDAPFEGVADLSEKLAKSADVSDCFARQWVKFSYGVSENDASRTLSKQVAQELGATGMPIRALVKRLAAAEHFVKRRKEALTPFTIPDAPAAPGAAPGAPPAVPGTPPPTTGLTTTAGITLTVVENDHGNGQYQKEVTLKNTTAAPIDWTAVIPARGAINQKWNCESRTEGASFVFTGAPYNKTIAPGGTTSFGFIAK